MGKTFIVTVFLVLLISCQGDKNSAVVNDTSTFEISIEKWPKKSSLTAKTKEILKDWPEFNALETSFDAIYTINNTEDLSLVLEDLIEKQKLLQESDYPEAFNKAQIKSRQKVFHTFILKTKGDLIYRVDMQISVLQMIEAHNTMLNQMNVITGNVLDLKTLLDEE